MTPFNPGRVRRLLKEAGIDGWLFYYFQKNDPVAEGLLDAGRRFATRRWFYFIPAAGSPVKVLHRIEADALDHLPGRAVSYLSWQELASALRTVLGGARTVAMQYSPRNAVPYLSRVDAGTVELVRSTGARVVSSGDLVQALEAPLTPGQERQHKRTALDLHTAVHDAFGFIGRRLRAGRRLTEYDVQQRILSFFSRRGLVTNAPPIVAVNANSGKPHYTPSVEKTSSLRKKDWVLIDLWAKPRGPEAIYADITWCAYAGNDVPGIYEDVFRTVRAARDAAVDLIGKKEGKTFGWQVDRAARSVIQKAGFGEYFIHRTGHSIGTEDHANGANMDSLETRESRRLLPRTLFSIEPGIYLKGFGARSEINVFMDGRRPVVTTPPQSTVVPLLR